MKYRAVLFDADGMVLLPKRFSDQIQQDYGISWEKMKPFFMGPFLLCKIGKADLKEELAKVLIDWGWSGTVDALLEYWFRIGSAPDPEIVAIAQELRSRRVKCFLATNQEKYRANYLQNVVRLNDVFDGMLVSAEIGYTKKEVAFFEKSYTSINANEELMISKKEILFVDHEEENMAAARAFGFETYSYHDSEHFREFVLGV